MGYGAALALMARSRAASLHPTYYHARWKQNMPQRGFGSLKAA